MHIMGYTRGDEIKSFGLRSGKNMDIGASCVFEKKSYNDLIQMSDRDSIVDTSTAKKFIALTCRLLSESNATLTFSDTSLGQFVIFKYPDGSEIGYLKTSRGLDERWVNYFSQKFLLNRSWYLHEKDKGLFPMPSI